MWRKKQKNTQEQMKNDKEKSIRAVKRFNRCMVLIEYLKEFHIQI